MKHNWMSLGYCNGDGSYSWAKDFPGKCRAWIRATVKGDSLRFDVERKKTLTKEQASVFCNLAKEFSELWSKRN